MLAQTHANHLSRTTSRRVGALAVGAVVLALLLAACGGSGFSAPPSVSQTLAPTPPASASAAQASASPSALASLSPAPSLTGLTLLWQKGGPTPSQPEAWLPAIDPITGNIWVAASFDNKFWIFSPDGKYLESWGTPGKGDGQLWLSTREVNPSGRGTITFDADGSFFVADSGNNRIEKFDKNRHFVLQFGGFGHTDGKFTRPLQVATDGTTVYVTDDDQMNLQAFDVTGHWLRTIPWPYGGIFFDAAGRIVTVSGGDTSAANDLALIIVDPSTGSALASDPLPPLGNVAFLQAMDRKGDSFMTFYPDFDTAPNGPGVGAEVGPTGVVVAEWSIADVETAVVAPDGKAIYYGGGWPYIRKYALPGH